jgi:plasmid stabilization system protein ParE
MAFKLKWSPSAKLDLKDIAAFIAEDNLSAAQRFVESLFQAVGWRIFHNRGEWYLSSVTQLSVK